MLEALGFHGRHVAYENNSTATGFIALKIPGSVIRGDVVARAPDDHGRCDVITAGFPCQPFSLLGLGLGREEAGGRGCLVDHTVLEIQKQRPRVFLLENVAAFTTSGGGAAHQQLMKDLGDDGLYELHERIICTSTSGIPQTRRRWYVIGLLKSAIISPFVWPVPIDPLPIEVILGPRDPSDSHRRKPPGCQFSAQDNVNKWRKILLNQGAEFSTTDFIMDCDASSSWCGKPRNHAPCLTKSRAKGLWLLSRGKIMSAETCCRLQGLCVSKLKLPAHDGATRILMGNAMSLSVVGRLLRGALLSVGLVSGSTPDRWANGAAQLELTQDIWGIHIPERVVDVLPPHVRKLVHHEQDPAVRDDAREGRWIA